MNKKDLLLNILAFLIIFLLTYATIIRNYLMLLVIFLFAIIAIVIRVIFVKYKIPLNKYSSFKYLFFNGLIYFLIIAIITFWKYEGNIINYLIRSFIGITLAFGLMAGTYYLSINKGHFLNRTIRLSGALGAPLFLVGFGFLSWILYLLIINGIKFDSKIFAVFIAITLVGLFLILYNVYKIKK